MISVSEAKQVLFSHCTARNPVSMDLYEAAGKVLAEDVYAPYDSPPFDQSAMDGYAFRFSEASHSLRIIGEVAAGNSVDIPHELNTAVRIFTGAPVPDCFDSVMMQEKVERNNECIKLLDTEHKKGMNIRLRASQIQKGDLAVKAGAYINPGLAGYLAGLGISAVKVIPSLRVAIISTGDELVAPGSVLEAGKIFESNTYSLHAALKQMGIESIQLFRVKDHELETTEAIRKAIQHGDVILLSGGVSVGDYDFVSRALHACGVSCIFHKVKQKPGKPLYFGKINNTLVFGLPGNPAALLTCFYEYVAPAIHILMGRSAMTKESLVLSESVTKKAGLTHFLKAKTNGLEVRVLKAQESYLMSSFAEADCLVELEEESTLVEKGTSVRISRLQHETWK